MAFFRSIPDLVFFISTGLIPIGLAFLLASVAKVLSIKLAFQGFTDIYEEVDYTDLESFDDENPHSKPKGKVRAHYAVWERDRERILVEGKLEKAGDIFSGSNKVEISIDEAYSFKPEGITCYLVDVTTQMEEFATLTLKARNGILKFAIEVKEEMGFSRPTTPLLCRIAIRSRTRVGALSRSWIENTHTYQFFIGPDYGEVWVGIDPGTNATCITAGSTAYLGQDNEVVIEKSADGKEKITASKIVFPTDRRPESELDKNNIPSDLYRAGDDAEQSAYFGSEDGKSFQSIKKLLGYKDEQIIRFRNDKELRLTGRELTTLLVRKIYADFTQYVERPQSPTRHLLTGGNFKPQKAVVAIPNNFTALKIQDMLDSIRGLNQFKEIRYVYEAEAVLLYCIRNKTSQFNSGTILVFDMGGSTINATLVKAHREGDQYYIQILGKIGYGVGGDSIDYCLGKNLYDFSRTYPLLSQKAPFQNTQSMDETGRKAQMDLRIKLRDDVLEPWKKIIVENYLKQKENFLLVEGKISRQEEQIRNKLIGFLDKKRLVEGVADDFLLKFYEGFHDEKGRKGLETRYLKNYLYDSVKDATKEILRYSEGAKIDTVIFSGRTVFFPGVKEAVKATFEQENSAQFPRILELNLEEAKTAVAKGACIFGLLGSNIHLENNKTFSSFGYAEANGMGVKELTFHELVPMGRTFDLPIPELKKPHQMSYTQEVKRGVDKKFGLDGNWVKFYQVMDANPEKALKEGLSHRYSLIGSIKAKKMVEEIALRVFENDLITCAIKEKGDNRPIQSRVEIPDLKIAQDNEDHYTWLLQ